MFFISVNDGATVEQARLASEVGALHTVRSLYSPGTFLIKEWKGGDVTYSHVFVLNKLKLDDSL